MIGGAGMHSSSLSQTCLPANVLIYNWEKRYGRVICSLSKRNTDCDTLKKIVGTAWSKWLDLSSQQVHEQLGIEQSGSVCRSLINTSSFCLSVQTIHSAILWVDHHWTCHHTYVDRICLACLANCSTELGESIFARSTGVPHSSIASAMNYIQTGLKGVLCEISSVSPPNRGLVSKLWEQASNHKNWDSALWAKISWGGRGHQQLFLQKCSNSAKVYFPNFILQSVPGLRFFGFSPLIAVLNALLCPVDIISDR